MHDFWPHCGYRLLETDADGRLRVTDAFLAHLLERPELAPVPESGPGELALHERLLRAPREAITDDDLRAVEDEDARANYAVWLRFRERLLARPTLEGSYLALFARDVDVPPVFVHQLTQILLRHILGAQASAMQARVAEMLFRPQKIAVQEDGQVMAADDETVERQALAGSFGTIGELLRQGGAPLRDENAESYWERDEAHDFVVSLTHGQPALQALCEVLQRWVRHFLGIAVTIEVEREIDDERWVWHVGLDAQASGVLNALYQGEDVERERMERMLCLFRLQFADPADMRQEIAGRPVYLAMAMDADRRLKLKPQNLLLNLPLARAS